MAKRVPLPNGVTCPTDSKKFQLPKGVPLPDDVLNGTETLDPTGLEIPGWQGEIPKIKAYAQEVGYDATCPPWLCDHAVEHCEGPDPKPSCDTCAPWLNLWRSKEFPYGMIRSNTGRGIDREIHGYDSFTALCGLWASPDFFADCCDYFDPDGNQIPREVIEYAIAYSSEILYRMSGRQFPGMCERVVQPGCEQAFKLSPAYRDTAYQRDTDYIDYGPDFWDGAGDGSIDARASQYLSSNGIGCCANSCGGGSNGCNPDTIRLPGPINQIIEIVIDGQVLDPSRYAIRAHKDLVRLDGQPWPKYNDLRRSPFESPVAPLSNISTCKPNVSKTGWVKPYLKHLDMKTPKELKASLKAPRWVNEFLLKNPELLQTLPCQEPWVAQWLAANGLKAMKIPGSCNEDQVFYTEIEVTDRGGFPANFCCGQSSEGIDTSLGNQCCQGAPAETRTVLIPTTISVCDDPIISEACDFLVKDLPCDKHIHVKDCKFDKVVADLSKSKGGCSAWAIRYYQGKCPPLSGQLAAAALARQIAEFMCVEKCFPQNTARLVSEGLDVRFISRFQSIYPGHSFGIAEVDLFMNSVNPYRLQRRGYAKRPGSRTESRKIWSLR